MRSRAAIFDTSFENKRAWRRSGVERALRLGSPWKPAIFHLVAGATPHRVVGGVLLFDGSHSPPS
jgi:hypothetical protein